MTVELDLGVFASDVVDRPIGVVADKITSLVHASSLKRIVAGGDGLSPGWVVDESLRSLDFVVQVSTSNGGPFNDKLAYTANRHELIVISWMYDPKPTSASGTDSTRLGHNELVIQCGLVSGSSYY